ncbi:MAG: Crp/Fnr family transcriptional regulator [Firmicutes bacterium]|nr:Crp/Fnr family transcriptional regulator [Bacillota bacterium]
MECIRKLSLFRGFDDGQFEEMLQCAEKRVYTKNQVLFLEGDPADKIFILKMGAVKLSKLSSDGKELILGFLGPDDIFGEDSAFSGEDYSVTATALEETCTLVFTKANMERIFLRNPAMALKVIESLSKKLTQSTNQVTDMAFRDAKGRLANILLRLSSEYGKDTIDGVCIDLSLTHQDLASIASLSRPTVTNLLLDLKGKGLIKTCRRRIVLKDATGLEAWAG